VFQDTKPPYQDVVESRFLADAEQACYFEFEEYQYELDFVTMRQTNVRTGTKREVCRRPCFISELDLKTGGLYVLLLLLSYVLNVVVENVKDESLTHSKRRKQERLIEILAKAKTPQGKNQRIQKLNYVTFQSVLRLYSACDIATDDKKKLSCCKQIM